MAKRRTRLKGTQTHKPCCECGKTKDRFKDFRPRWAGCATHRTERGRRYFEPGCAECVAVANGNIRQPRCVDCDKARPKKGKGKAAPAPTPVVVEPETAEPVLRVLPPVEPEPVEAEPVEAAPEPEPVVVGMEEAAPESVVVDPEPAPEPAAPAPEPKKVKTMSDIMADLSGLFGDEDGDQSE